MRSSIVTIGVSPRPGAASAHDTDRMAAAAAKPGHKNVIIECGGTDRPLSDRVRTERHRLRAI